MVNYINTAPIYEIWKRVITDTRYQVIEQPPSVLNKLLAAGKIDLGFVSSYEYCARPELYRILSDLSISATGAVGSVFLFSELPLEDLDNKPVLLSNQSETSVLLVKIILEEFYSLQPQYIVGEIMGEIRTSCKAVMAIGDDALRLVSSGFYAYQLDLSEIWYEKTGLPFVFSVCAIRDDFCTKKSSLAEKVRHDLLRCRDRGQDEIEDICYLAAPRIPMEYDKCFRYLQLLEYDLEPKKCEALEKFYGYLINRGEAKSSALPLRFFP